jgi:hypothetical protein
MQTFIADIIPKLQSFSKKLDDLTLLTNQHWVVLDELKQSKNVYIFRANNELLISSNGKVEKGKWEYLGNNSLLIDRNEDSYLFKHGFFDENVMALKIDGKEEYALLVNENRFDGELNSVDKVTEFLGSKYLSIDSQNKINTVGRGGSIENKQTIIEDENDLSLNNLIIGFLAVMLFIVTVCILLFKGSR